MRTLIFLTAVAAFAAAPLTTQALTAAQTVQKEVTVVGADGTPQRVLESADKVVPGERIVYTLNYTNDEAEAASDIVLTMPIPKEVTFVEGSADARNATVTYSADNGQSFGSRQSVMLLDGAGNVRAASAADLTHVRWTITNPVAAGTSGQLAFSADLN